MLMKQNRQTGSISTHSLYSNLPAAEKAKEIIAKDDAYFLYFVQEQEVNE